MRAKADHDSDRITGVIEGAYPFTWRYMNLEPLASVRYTAVYNGSISESGAAGVDLHLNSRSDSLLSSRLGLRFYTTLFKYEHITPWLEWADGIWTSELNASWRRISVLLHQVQKLLLNELRVRVICVAF